MYPHPQEMQCLSLPRPPLSLLSLLQSFYIIPLHFLKLYSPSKPFLSKGRASAAWEPSNPENFLSPLSKYSVFYHHHPTFSSLSLQCLKG
jgi:hypothetical protein